MSSSKQQQQQQPQQQQQEQQQPQPQCPYLTTTAGTPWANNNDVLTAGERGPTLLQDYQLLEKLAHQNRERVPERTVHAKGWGAFGTLRITKDISKYTCAKVLQQGTETPMLARFSTVAGEAGAADFERDVRGFALKFYTEEGNWDLVGNNTPIFFVRDAIKFPDFIHALKRHPQTHQRSPTALFDFLSLSPESLHQLTYVMGDRGVPKNLRNMNGYGSHTFSLWTADKQRVWVKFHFKSQQGMEYISNDEAEKLTGMSRDLAGADLFNAIERGEFPKWKFQIQVMTDQQAASCEFDPFDLTKVWPHGDYPLIDVGEFELNRNADNYFAQIEQAAFDPSSVVPGIGFSPDKMLQARLFAYADTHRYRLGGNYQHLPVNLPRCPVANYHRDGQFNTFGGLQSGNPNAFYEPNSFGGPREVLSAQEPPLEISGVADRFNHRDKDDFSQVRKLFLEVYDDAARERLFQNIVGAWPNVPEAIIERQLALFGKVHESYEAGCRKAWNELKSKGEYAANAIPMTLDTPHGTGDLAAQVAKYGKDAESAVKHNEEAPDSEKTSGKSVPTEKQQQKHQTRRAVKSGG